METKLALYARAPKIRIEAWLRKFCEQVRANPNPPPTAPPALASLAPATAADGG